MWKHLLFSLSVLNEYEISWLHSQNLNEWTKIWINIGMKDFDKILCNLYNPAINISERK